MRKFAELAGLQLSMAKLSYSASTIFSGSGYDPMDKRMVLAELETNSKPDEENSCAEIGDTLNEVLSEGCEHGVVHVLLSRVDGPLSRLVASAKQGVQMYSISGKVDIFVTSAFLIGKMFHVLHLASPPYSNVLV